MLQRFKLHTWTLCYICIFLIFLTPIKGRGGQPQDVPHAPFEIEIGMVSPVIPGHYISVPVAKIGGPEEIFSFDFSIGFNCGALTVYGITPGELFEIPGSFEWEYLNYRMAPPFFGENLTHLGVIRVIGISDIDNGSHQPLTAPVPDGIVLFYLNFHVTIDWNYRCAYIPIRFLWNDCGNNKVAFLDSGETKIAISDRVYDLIPASGYQEITDATADFPTTFGAPEVCLGKQKSDNLMRLIDFRNGGVEIPCPAGVGTGNLNLNWTPYEISDAITYCNYFLYGLSAFRINIDGQISESDIDRDGQTLTVTDYYRLIRIIEGLAVPVP